MSTENAPAEPTEAAAAAPKGKTVKPNNQYQDIIAESVSEASDTAEETAAKPIKPDNQYQD